jgi:hypothetical protein
MEEYEWNGVVYSAKFSFWAVIVKSTTIYITDATGLNFFR